MSEPIRGAEPHFTPEEFARLEPGDLVAAKSGSEYAILARDPHEASPTYAARWLGTSSPKIYARVDDPRCYAPTGPTKERLRPTPVEQGQTWRHRETRADWSLRRLEYDPFTDESHGTDWAHLVSTCCGAERKIAAKVLRRDYELVRTNPDHSAEAARQAFARGAEAALRDERRAEGESRLAADLARTAPEAVFRPGWWYYECATGEWWMVEGGGGSRQRQVRPHDRHRRRVRWTLSRGDGPAAHVRRGGRATVRPRQRPPPPTGGRAMTAPREEIQTGATAEVFPARPDRATGGALAETKLPDVGQSIDDEAERRADLIDTVMVVVAVAFAAVVFYFFLWVFAPAPIYAQPQVTRP